MFWIPFILMITFAFCLFEYIIPEEGETKQQKINRLYAFYITMIIIGLIINE